MDEDFLRDLHPSFLLMLRDDLFARMHLMLGRRIIESLAEQMEEYSTIQLAYLFGSHAKGVRRRIEDIDIAVLLKKKLSAEAKLRFINDLSSALEAIVESRIDLVVLNDASPFLKHQVLKYGKLIYERDEKMTARFRYEAMSDYLSLKPLHDFFVDRMYKRHGVRRG